MVAPFAETLQRLDEMTGLGAIGACGIIAEIGLDNDPLPHPEHLASWPSSPPGQGVRRQEGGRGSTGHRPGGSALRLLNPGSPTDRRRQPTHTWMTAEVVDGVLADVVLRHIPS